jgi:hypothetical protein
MCLNPPPPRPTSANIEITYSATCFRQQLKLSFLGVPSCCVQLPKYNKRKFQSIATAYIRGVSKRFGEWYQKANKTEDINKLTLLAFKIIAILHNTLLATFIKLLETVSKGLFRNRSQNCCHTLLDCRHVNKTCAFHDSLQAGKQKEVHPPCSPDLGARSGDHLSAGTRNAPRRWQCNAETCRSYHT